MANRSATQYQKELKEIKLKEMEYVKKHQITCNHTGATVLLSSYNGSVPNRQKYPKTTLIDEDCGAIFDSARFTPDDVDTAFFRIESMCHQIKLLTAGALDADRRDELESIMIKLDSVRTNLEPYYNSMVKALANSNNESKRRQDKQFGGIGISANTFGGR